MLVKLCLLTMLWLARCRIPRTPFARFLMKFSASRSCRRIHQGPMPLRTSRGRSLWIIRRRIYLRPGERGYTRAYILAPDDTTKTPEIVGGREIYPPRPYPDALQPDELHDSDLMRYQFCNWRWRTPVLTANGETVDDVLKINDDFGQSLQMVYFKKLLSNIPLSKTEKIELHLSPQIRENVLAEMEQSPEKDALFNRRRLELAQLDKQFKKPVRGSSLNRFSRR